MTLTDAANPSGTTNFSGYTTSSYLSSGGSFTANTATLVTSAATSAICAGVSLSGLALGWHKIKIAKTAGAASLYFIAADVISPIYFPKENLGNQNNTLMIGNCSLGDARNTTFNIKEGKAWAQAIGITSGPTTTNTSAVPCPDMHLSFYTKGSVCSINYSMSVTNSSTNPAIYAQVYINGTPANVVKFLHCPVASYYAMLSDDFKIYLPAGYYNISLMWYTSSSTATAGGTSRSLSIIEE
jgi:hypothetical protein